MLGFVFGMTGVQDGRLVHWSDLLAVRPEARDRGLGRRLKLYQRSLVAELGVTRMLWTYDPLVARNAHLNLNALGARGRRVRTGDVRLGHGERAARRDRHRSVGRRLGAHFGRRYAGTNFTSRRRQRSHRRHSW